MRTGGFRLFIFVLLATTINAVADEATDSYVIRITPTLVYLDAGSDRGTRLGEAFVIVREEHGRLAHLADVRVIRVYPAFAIADLLYLEAHRSLRVLDRAMPLTAWENRNPDVVPASVRTAPGNVQPQGTLAVYLLGGGEWARDGDGLKWQDGRLVRVEQGSGAALGVRLSTLLRRSYRASMTCRASFGQDVTAVGVELGVELAPRGWDQMGPYVGVGIGVQHLAWDAPAQVRGSANQLGTQLLAGVVVPGRLDLLLEAGYQRVTRWQNLMDVSHIRTYVGVGRTF